MTLLTTTNDVFEMAKGMERIGKDFYEALAQDSNDAQVREFSRNAARDEASHLTIFTAFQKQWASSPPDSMDPDRAGKLAALMRDYILPDPQAAQTVAIGGKLKDALKMAMRMEQDSIDFYQGMAAQLPGWAVAFEAIIAQEKQHLANLKRLRA